MSLSDLRKVHPIRAQDALFYIISNTLNFVYITRRGPGSGMAEVRNIYWENHALRIYAYPQGQAGRQLEVVYDKTTPHYLTL